MTTDVSEPTRATVRQSPIEVFYRPDFLKRLRFAHWFVVACSALPFLLSPFVAELHAARRLWFLPLCLALLTALWEVRYWRRLRPEEPPLTVDRAGLSCDGLGFLPWNEVVSLDLDKLGSLRVRLKPGSQAKLSVDWPTRIFYQLERWFGRLTAAIPLGALDTDPEVLLYQCREAWYQHGNPKKASADSPDPVQP